MRARPCHCALLPTLCCVLVVAACSNDPRQLMVGTWGLDLSPLTAEIETARRHGELALYAAEAKRDRLARIEVAFDADGTASMLGTGVEGSGSYVIESVDGDRLRVRVSIASVPELPVELTLHGRRRMSMTIGDGAQTLEFVRR